VVLFQVLLFGKVKMAEFCYCYKEKKLIFLRGIHHIDLPFFSFFLLNRD